MYYQSNYFVSAFAIFALVFLARPQEMILGLILMSLSFGISFLLQNHQLEVRNFRQQHPLIVTFACFTLGYYLIYKLTSVAVFILGILMPILFIIIHASMRMRNVLNKFANATNVLGLTKQTPMGMVLESVGIEPNFKYQ